MFENWPEVPDWLRAAAEQEAWTEEDARKVARGFRANESVPELLGDGPGRFVWVHRAIYHEGMDWPVGEPLLPLLDRLLRELTRRRIEGGGGGEISTRWGAND